jgi:hypothetical protein
MQRLAYVGLTGAAAEIGYLGENARTRASEELEWRIACDRLLKEGVIASEATLLELCWSEACSIAANSKIWRAICLVADDLLVGAPVPEESVIDRVCFTQASHRPNLFLNLPLRPRMRSANLSQRSFMPLATGREVPTGSLG